MQDKEAFAVYARGQIERTRAAERIATILSTVAGVDIPADKILYGIMVHWRVLSTAAHVIHGPDDVSPMDVAAGAANRALSAEADALLASATALKARVDAMQSEAPK